MGNIVSDQRWLGSVNGAQRTDLVVLPLIFGPLATLIIVIMPKESQGE